MDTTYRLTQTGPEVQQALDQVAPIETAIAALNEGKVDKEEGKGLSHNDFTDADRQKLANLPTEATLNQELATKQNVIDDLPTIRSGAAAGAQAAPQATTYTKTEVDALTADFITRTVNNLTNYYLKTETYTQAEVQQLIAAVKQFRYQSVAELPTASAETMGIIYLVPSSNPKTQNLKDEYITVSTTNEQQVTTYAWEQIGSTTVDLSGYYTSAQTDAAITAALNTALASYSTTAQMNSAIAAALAPYYTKTEVDAAIADFITRTVNNLTNYYLKTETYTQAEVQQLIAAVKQFRYQSVAELPTASAETMGIIYLVPSPNPSAQNVKDEFITVSTTNEQQVTTYSWEQIGSTTVDLSGYYTSAQTDAAITAALNIALASYSTTAQMNAAIATALSPYYTKTEIDALLAGKLGATETAAAATQLANSRTLWGQPFNGTQDVSGDMSGVGSLSMNGVLSGARGEFKQATRNKVQKSDFRSALQSGWDATGATAVYDATEEAICLTKSGTPVNNYDYRTGTNQTAYVTGHKYICLAKIKSNATNIKANVYDYNRVGYRNLQTIILSNTAYKVASVIATALQDTPYVFLVEGLNNDGGNVPDGTKMWIKWVQCIDLTSMFGAGNEPATATEFARRLGYASIDDVPYTPYAENLVPLTDAMAVGGDLIVREKIAPLTGPLNIAGSELALSEGLHIKYDATTNTVTFCDASGNPSKIVYDNTTT